MLKVKFEKPVKVVDATIELESGELQVTPFREGEIVGLVALTDDGTEVEVEGMISKLDTKAMLLRTEADELPVYVEYDKIIGILLDEEE